MLLSFIGQGLLSDGHWMISKISSNTSDTPHSQMAMDMPTGSDCHGDESSRHTETQQAKNQSKQSCCEGDNQCQESCNHCLVIASAIGVFSIKSWPATQTSQVPLVITLPHFHSISPDQIIRPPIALS